MLETFKPDPLYSDFHHGRNVKKGNAKILRKVPCLHYNVLGTACAWNGATFFRHGTALHVYTYLFAVPV